MEKSELSMMLEYLPREVTTAISPLGFQEDFEYKEVTLPTRDILTAFLKLKEMALKEVCRRERNGRKLHAINAIERMSYLRCSPIR